MILPGNGKIVIIDDKIEEVKPIMRLLSKEGASFSVYSDENGDDLPDGPLRNIRLVFLDLILNEATTQSSRQVIAAISNRLLRIVSTNNGPYILAIWSAHANDHFNDVKVEFNKEPLKEIKPFAFVRLTNKIKIIKGNKAASDTLKKQINKAFLKYPSLMPILHWEKLANEAGGKTVNDFVGLIKGNGKEWNKGASHIYYRLAKAYLGKNSNDSDAIQLLKAAYTTLGVSFLDSFESHMFEDLPQEFGAIEYLKEFSGISPSIAAEMNNRLLISNNPTMGLYPGNVYYPIKDLENKVIELDQKKNTQISTLKSNEKIPLEKREGVIKKLQKKYDDCISGLKEIKKNKERDSNEILNGSFNRNITPKFIKDDAIELLRKKDIKSGTKQWKQEKKDEVKSLTQKLFTEIRKESIFVELHISPLCDYAQKKMQVARMLSGLLIPIEYLSYLNGTPAYNYLEGIPLQIGSQQYVVVFDFRFLRSEEKKKVEDATPKFRLRHQLMADIQLQLSSHVNRPGVLYVV